MTEEEKKLYKEQMIAKSIIYAEEKLADTKAFVDKEEYEEVKMEFANAFLAGVDASIKWLKDQNKKKRVTIKPLFSIATSD